MYEFPLPLYVFNLSASILWIWNFQSSILLWIKYHKSSDIPRIFVMFIVWLLILAFRIVLSISVIIMFASSATLHLVSRSLLNMLCIIYPFGSSSWNASKPMFFEILKSPYPFWFSFFEGWFKWIFLFSSHMLSPTFNS